MCAVSVIFDHYNQPTNVPMQPVVWPNALPATLPWTPELFEELKKVIARLDDIDKKLGLEHCEDPKKAKWMKAVERRLRKMEKAKK